MELLFLKSIAQAKFCTKEKVASEKLMDITIIIYQIVKFLYIKFLYTNFFKAVYTKTFFGCFLLISIFYMLSFSLGIAIIIIIIILQAFSGEACDCMRTRPHAQKCLDV